MSTFRVERLDHVAVDVANVQKAREFYAGLLALRELPRPDSFDFPGAWFDTGSGVIHIVERHPPDTGGKRHFCIVVDDLTAARKALSAAGVPIFDDGRGTIPGVERFYASDPDGNRIEFQSVAESK